MVASALLRISLSIEEWLAATNFMKYCTLKKCSLRLTTRKKCFLGTYESLRTISRKFCTSVNNCGIIFQRF